MRWCGHREKRWGILAFAGIVLYMGCCVFAPRVDAATTLAKPSNNLGLVGYWSFNEGTSTVATDFSGNGHHGTLSGATSPAWVSGKRATALDFDGSSSYVAVGDVGTVRSVSFWVYADDVTTRKIMNMNGTAQIELDGSSQVTATGFTSPTVYVNGSSASSVLDTGWHFVTVTTGSGVSASTVDIGRVASGYFDGRIDEVRVYNRVLSADEIDALYRSGSIRFTSSSVELQKGSSLANGLVGHWTFDGLDTQTTITDRSGQGNHGYFYGGATSSAKTIGKLGQALTFNGTSNYVNAGNTASLSVSGNITVALWAKWTASGDYFVALSKNDSGNNRNGYAFWTDAVLDQQMVFQIANGTGNREVFSGGAPNDGRWHHFVGTWDGTTMRMYMDGVEGDNAPYTNTLVSSEYPLHIGRNAPPTGAEYFPGSLDDVRVYNRALSATEVKQLYNLGKATVR